MKGSMAVPRPARFMDEFLSPVQNMLLRFRRSTKAMSPSSIGCETSMISLAGTLASGRKTTGTIFWILCGMLRYEFWLDKYPGSPYAYGVRSPSRDEP